LQLTRYFYLAATLLALNLAGCASSIEPGRELIAAGQPEAGLERLRADMAKEPDNIELKAYYHTQREKLTNQLLVQAQQEQDAKRFDAAEATLRRVLVIHPENPRANTLFNNLAMSRQHEQSLQTASQALAAGRTAEAEQAARLIMAQSPHHAGAQALLREIQSTRSADELAPRELGGAYRKPITLEFRDAPLRNVFDMIARQSGINFVFDKDVRLDTKATLFARNTPIADAVDMLLLTGQLSKKVVNPNTLLIYPDQPQKHKGYQELMVKSFYLGNADAKTTMAMLRTLVKSKDVYVDERLNLLVIRDTPEAIRLAEKVIAVQDLAEPEVMLQVEVLEVKRGRLLDLGVQYPNQFSLINPGPVTSPLTLESLKNISANDIAISPTPEVNVKEEHSDVNILANPRIRVKNREKAKIHIGDKVPVITSNTTSTGVISESVSYLDVGLKLDVEPNVLMHDDVQIKVALEVSNIVKEIRSLGGSLTYQIGTRNAGTTLRLKDGETQVLAGLIADEDRTSSSGIPGLTNLPFLNRLFSTQSDERIKTEIVLLITPHVLRSDATRQPAMTEFRGGTESAIGGGLATPFTPALESRLPSLQPALQPGLSASMPAESPNEAPPSQDLIPAPPIPQIPPPEPVE
jgi:general secretion pathway protein D